MVKVEVDEFELEDKELVVYKKDDNWSSFDAAAAVVVATVVAVETMFSELQFVVVHSSDSDSGSESAGAAGAAYDSLLDLLFDFLPLNSSLD